MTSTRFLLALFCLSTTQFSFAFTVSSDQQYYVYDDNSYRFIYSEDYRPFIKALADRNADIKAFYEKDFSWKLDEKPYLILPSPRNQIANGFATTLPSLFTVFYGGGAETVDDFAASSWLDTLLAHETSHLYQTDVKQSYSKFLKAAFKNAAPSLAPPFTYMITPNIFLPTFILEGNATYNEGRFGNGGRLYSGENRALFLSLLKAGKVNSKRLINDHINWPYGREKYVVGSYVQMFLGKQYGVDKVNAFFLKNSRHFMNPFQLRKGFFETFGVGYEDVIKNLNAAYATDANKMKSSPETIAPIASSISNGGITREGSNVYFMTTDGKTMPRLYEVKKDASGMKVTKSRHNIPFGKPHMWNNEIYVSSSEQIHSNAIRYSLFTDGYSHLKEFEDKVVYSTRGRSALYADVPHSFERVQLYDNGKYLGTTDSSALYDADGNPIFFRQSGNQRTLYRGATPIATYKGYYGKVADTAKNGDVYIIAATENGSSLFRVHERSIQRVLTSDTIVGAALLSESEVLVSEITDNGYTFKALPLETPRNDGPAYYEYFYEKDPSMIMLSSDRSTTKENAIIPPNEETYSSFRYFKYDGLDPFFAGVTLAGDIIAGIGARLSDPMQFHALSFNYAHLEGDTNDVRLMYENRYHKLNWLLAGSFIQKALFQDKGKEDEKVLDRYQTYKGIFELDYPLFTRPQWDSTITSRYTYEYDETNSTNPDLDLDQQQSVLNYVDLRHNRSYMLAYDTNASDRIVIAHEALGDIPKWEGNRVKYAAEVTTTRDILKETYLTAGYHIVKSDSPKPDVEIEHKSITGLTLELENPTELNRYSGNSKIEYHEAHQLNLGFKQAINTGFYFSKFPVALRRFAPFANYNEFYGRMNSDVPLETLFHEWAWGGEFELLLLHKFPVRLVAAGVESSARKGSDFTTFISTAHRF